MALVLYNLSLLIFSAVRWPFLGLSRPFPTLEDAPVRGMAFVREGFGMVLKLFRLGRYCPDEKERIIDCSLFSLFRKEMLVSNGGGREKTRE